MAVLPLMDSMGVFSNPLLLALYSALLSMFSYIKVSVVSLFFPLATQTMSTVPRTLHQILSTVHHNIHKNRNFYNNFK